MDDPQLRAYLQIELAVVIDFGHPFVQATYNLEGDEDEVISTLTTAVSLTNPHYPNLQAVPWQMSGVDPHYPNLQAVPWQMSGVDPHYPNLQAVPWQMSGVDTNVQQQMIQYEKECAQPAMEYFKACLSGPLKIALSAFKAARLFVPDKLTEMKPDSSDIDSLTAFPFLSNQETLSALKTELSQYLAQADGISSDNSPLEFRKRRASSLPNWASAAVKVLVVQPSSAALEQIFSLLNNSFSDEQERSLQDYIETSLMLQNNKHIVFGELVSY